jgi:hypothetical protein
MTPDRPRLDSWKEIAHYLGRDVRTVIRWERDRGLPVSRVPGGKRSRVFAHPDELDHWLTHAPAHIESEPIAPTAPIENSSAWPRPLLAGGLLLAVVLLASLPNSAGGAAPVRVSLTDTDLQAFGAGDQLLWSRRVTSTRVQPSSTRWWFVGQLDGDTSPDVLAAIEATQPSPDPPRGALPRLAGDATLWRYSAGGAAQWSFTATDQIRVKDDGFGPPWALSDLAVYSVGGRRRIAWAVHQFTWWPSLLISLNEQGDRLGTFVNAGWIRAVEATPDGKYLLVTGVSNSRSSYVLAVLDAARPFGRSPEPPGSATECLNCEAGDPVKYFVWPRTDVSMVQSFPADGPSISTFGDGSVHVHVHETMGPGIGTSIYELTPDMTLRAARFSDAFWTRHDALQQAGALDHAGSSCPERAGRRVDVWTPASGWQPVTVAVR